MARIRTVKPETWTDEKVVLLRPLARLLFIGTWNFADDEGRMEYSPLSLKLRVLPMDKIEIEELIKELEAVGLVQVYQAQGKSFLQVTNFSKHQKIDKRLKSRYPAPPIHAESPRLSPNHPTGMEGNGKESKGKKQKPPVAVAPVDERKAAIREAIKKGYAWKNENRECPWGVAEETILKRILLEVPRSYTAEFFVQCIRNKFKSDEAHSPPPREWLKFILTYADGPIDRFRKPKTLGESGNGNGKPNKATERFNSNVEAIAQGFGLRHSNHDDTHDSELAELQRLSGNGERLEGRVATNERPIRVIDASGDCDPVHSGAKRISADSGNDS